MRPIRFVLLVSLPFFFPAVDIIQDTNESKSTALEYSSLLKFCRGQVKVCTESNKCRIEALYCKRLTIMRIPVI